MENRRELKSRKFKIFHHMAYYLAQKNIMPNQISLMSMVFAFMGMLALVFYPKVQGTLSFFLLIFIFLMVQGRLLCNLIDGLVAIEGGKKTKFGEFFNDFPDRISDIFFFIGVGYAANMPYLGFLAAILAVLTAYIRILVAFIDAPISFKGPMAKQHRMAMLNIAILLSLTASFAPSVKFLFFKATLIVIIIGCIITCFNRAKQGYIYLENQSEKRIKC